MKITFLLYNAYGIGGTIRATTNLATALAARHEVEIVSCVRTADTMRLAAGPGVRVRSLVDLRPRSRAYAGDEPGQRIPGTVCPHDAPYRGKTPPSRLTEERLAHFLRGTDADVVVATRPYLVSFLARHGRADCLRIGQEHLTHAFHREELRREQDAALAELDAFVTVSEGDARAYRAALPDVGTRLTHIPNCCPAPEAEPSAGDSRTVVAAGRLIPVKRYDRLVGAFAKVAAQHPDWTLRIYGRGREQAKLRRRIDELGLHDHVFLMGPHTPIDTEWAKGAIAAVSSSTESFGMTIVEAMRLGVPVVSTDCDYGPREIITHGEDGLLVPLDRPETAEDGLADALCRLIANDAERHRMARAARHNARRFLPDHVARQYEALIADLAPHLATAPAAPETAPVPDGPRARTGLRARAGALAERLGVAALLGKALPRVDVGCRAAGDGSLTFRVPTAELAPGEWQLELRPRHGTGGGTVPLPFRVLRGSHAQDAATALVVLPREGGPLPERGPLAEGHWDVHLRQLGRGGRSRRAAAGLVETGRLLSPRPADPSGAGHVAAVPYATGKGQLAVRTWARARHAELGPVGVSGTRLMLDGTLHGATAPGGYRLTCHLRGTGSATGAASGTGPVTLEVPCRTDGCGRFTADLPLSLPAAWHPGGDAVWDVRLTPVDGGKPVRPARLFGDVVERKRTDVFPPARVPTPHGDFTVRPYLTVRNNLALKVTGSEESARSAAADPMTDAASGPGTVSGSVPDRGTSSRPEAESGSRP
ncbi:glycosyltransferase [Streptomyces sp. HNM0574]|uniref:glycosyltransferase n=1 Tax=Streptomyces sp. HNM0574 TaxID=2714954 RepID=UPI00146C4071|nr:glycosyltransferase [Streptomyces sp. HNM0574]NLU68671.1 glycosyltransferase family 4 protein [Streptomyces sp. HNM0574]